MTVPPTPEPTSQDSPPPAPFPAWMKQSQNQDPMTDARLEAFIGRNWESAYRAKFQGFRTDPSFVPTWNWSAALLTPWWFLYRKLYLPFLVFFLVPQVVPLFFIDPARVMELAAWTDPDIKMIVVGLQISLHLAAGGVANWLLFRRARAATAFTAMHQLPDIEARALLARIGGVNTRMTVLIVVIVMAVQLAGMAAGLMT